MSNLETEVGAAPADGDFVTGLRRAQGILVRLSFNCGLRSVLTAIGLVWESRVG